MKKSLLFVTLLALVVVAGSPFVSQARPAEASVKESEHATTSTTTSVERDHRDDKMSEDIQAKRDEIEHRLTEKRAEIREKLSGKRAQSCEKKQATINQILDNRINAASSHLEHFKDIQNKLVAFVDRKNLAVDNASALEVIMNDAQAAAQATIDAAAATNFSCSDADAAAPGRIVTEQVSAQKQALMDYRSAIKDYAQAVKNAYAATAAKEEGAD